MNGTSTIKRKQKFLICFGDNVWTLSLQSNIAPKFCLGKVAEKFSCNRNVHRPEEQQLLLLRDGSNLLSLQGFLGCWLLMFFPGGCQHCSSHTGVQLLSLTRVCKWGQMKILQSYFLGIPVEGHLEELCVWQLQQDGIWWREGAAGLGFFWRVLTQVLHLKMKYEGELMHYFMWWCVTYTIKETHIIWVCCYWFF